MGQLKRISSPLEWRPDRCRRLRLCREGVERYVRCQTFKIGQQPCHSAAGKHNLERNVRYETLALPPMSNRRSLHCRLAAGLHRRDSATRNRKNRWPRPGASSTRQVKPFERDQKEHRGGGQPQGVGPACQPIARFAPAQGLPTASLASSTYSVGIQAVSLSCQ